jgi:hypothetical protein
MRGTELLSAAHTIDPYTVAFYLEVPRSHIVLLQAYFELHEGMGTVRTLNKERGTVCVLTTPSLVSDCIEILYAIRDHVAWNVAPKDCDVLS